jgi:hypothetical protein
MMYTDAVVDVTVMVQPERSVPDATRVQPFDGAPSLVNDTLPVGEDFVPLESVSITVAVHAIV